MNADELTQAIKFLKPTSQFSFLDNDYLTIKWDVLDGEAPTIAELEAAHLLVKEVEAQAEAEAEAKREAAFSKLAALGLTADDLRALGL